MDKTELSVRFVDIFWTVTVIVFTCFAMTMKIMFPIQIQSNSLRFKLIIFKISENTCSCQPNNSLLNKFREKHKTKVEYF